MKNKLKKILIRFLIILLLVIMISIEYQKIYSSDKLVNLFGYSLLIVNTGSMEPTINRGEMIIIKREKSYKHNDIITYLDYENYFITHRIVNVSSNQYETKGDFNNMVDDPICYNQIKGKVVFHMQAIMFIIGLLFLSFIFIIVI